MNRCTSGPNPPRAGGSALSRSSIVSLCLVLASACGDSGPVSGLFLVGPDGSLRPSTPVPDASSQWARLQDAGSPDTGEPEDGSAGPPCTTATDCPPAPGLCFAVVCQGGNCGTEKTPGCYVSSAECDDGDDCTKDRCAPDLHVCLHDPHPGPGCGSCETAAHCDDEDVCTTDTCTGGHCQSTQIPGCCAAKEDCDDGDGCTEDACIDAVCANVAQPACCDADGDCDDGIACTADHCAIPAGKEAGACQHVKGPDCCSVLFATAFDSQAELVDWNLVKPNNEISWQVWDKRFASPPSSLYMGNPLAGNYINVNDFYPSQTLVSQASIRTPFFAVPENAEKVTATFKVYLDIEDCEGQSENYDLFVVRGETSTGQQLPLMNKCNVPEPWKAWQAVTLDLSVFKGATVGLRFLFNSMDNKHNETEGIFVDDLEVESCL